MSPLLFCLEVDAPTILQCPSHSPIHCTKYVCIGEIIFAVSFRPRVSRIGAKIARDRLTTVSSVKAMVYIF